VIEGLFFKVDDWDSINEMKEYLENL